MRLCLRSRTRLEPGIWEVEAGRPRVQSHPLLHSEFKVSLGCMKTRGGRKGWRRKGGKLRPRSRSIKHFAPTPKDLAAICLCFSNLFLCRSFHHGPPPTDFYLCSPFLQPQVRLYFPLGWPSEAISGFSFHMAPIKLLFPAYNRACIHVPSPI